MKITRKILKIILNILVVIVAILVLLVGYNFIQLKIQKKDYSNIFGYTFFEVSTGSMSDTIEIQDVVAVKITQDVSVGDIITYKDNNDFITHRIVKIDEDKIITKGDANNTEDKPITRADVIGKVVSIYSKLGVWIKVFSDYKVLLSLFTTIILFSLVFSEDNKKELNKKDKEKI